MSKLKVIMLSPGFDGSDVGESFVSYKWAEALSHKVDLTVLSFQRSTRAPLQHSLPKAEVVTWPEPAFLLKFERLNAMLKPAYPLLYSNVRKWVKTQQKAGRHFDVMHQIMPLPPRYPSPFNGLGVPFVMGPVGGALKTPAGFKNEVGTARWYTRLRGLDEARISFDPWLRSTFQNASLVLGVAPYVKEFLKPVDMQRFELFLELGIDALPKMPDRGRHKGLRLLHVGRGVRTKGLRDLIRAMALLKDLPDVTLTSAGSGEEIEICKQEAHDLGVSDRVEFLGKVPRADVETLYKDSDVFAFPSFREPTGNVIYEAMSWGLPIITANHGGPASMIDDDTGILLNISTPKQLTQDIAKAVRKLYDDTKLRSKLGNAARERVYDQGLWSNKIDRLVTLYESLLEKNDLTHAV